MWSIYFIEFLMLKVVIATLTLPDSNFSPSQCKPLSKCTKLVWLLKNKQNLPALEQEQVLDYIKRIQCGFHVKEPKIMCPKFDQAIEDDGINFNSTNRIVIDTHGVVSP